MDPNACLLRIASALHDIGVLGFSSGFPGSELEEACEDLRDWLNRRGFEPKWSDQPIAAGFFRVWASGPGMR